MTIRWDITHKGDDMSERYDIAQICLNGHVANSSSRELPQFNQKFCEKCGSSTITDCPECRSPIRGYYWGGAIGTTYRVPSYCINCGQPYPWTKSKLKAAHELTQELDNLSAEERAILDKSIDDMANDSPSTTVAATRFKKIMIKLGKDTAGMFREILVDVLSETAKKALWP